jgi:hypothetical protein
LLFACQNEEQVIPKLDGEKIGEELNTILAQDSIKEVEVYQGAKIIIQGSNSKLNSEIRGQYLYNYSSANYFDLNNLIFYEIRKGDSTLVLSF